MEQYVVNGRTPGGWRIVRRPPEGAPFPDLVALVQDAVVAHWIVHLLNQHPPEDAPVNAPATDTVIIPRFSAPDVAPDPVPDFTVWVPTVADASSRAEEPASCTPAIDPSPSPPDCPDPAPEGGFSPDPDPGFSGGGGGDFGGAGAGGEV